MSATIAYYHHILDTYNKRVLQENNWDRRLKLYRKWLHSRTKLTYQECTLLLFNIVRSWLPVTGHGTVSERDIGAFIKASRAATSEFQRDQIRKTMLGTLDGTHL